MKINIGRLTGEPVDEIDSLCRDLMNAYTCLNKDHIKCNPRTPYQWKLGKTGRPICGTCENFLKIS